MNVDLLLRKIAKKDYWQAVYSNSKEIGSIRIFKNLDDYSYLQIHFLSYLGFYNNLYVDIAMGDVGERVLENNIYEDAYVYFRNRERQKDKKEKVPESPVKSQKTIDRLSKNIKKENLENTTSWVLKKS